LETVVDKAEKLVQAQTELAGEAMQLVMKHQKAMMDLQLELVTQLTQFAVKSGGEALQIKDPSAAMAWRMQAMQGQTQMLAQYAQKLQTLMMAAQGETMTLMTRKLSQAGGSAMNDLQGLVAGFAKPQDAMKQMQEMFANPLAAMQEMAKSMMPVAEKPTKKGTKGGA
jgi:hypothetical protein